MTANAKATREITAVTLLSKVKSLAMARRGSMLVEACATSERRFSLGVKLVKLLIELEVATIFIEKSIGERNSYTASQPVQAGKTVSMYDRSV